MKNSSVKVKIHEYQWVPLEIARGNRENKLKKTREFMEVANFQQADVMQTKTKKGTMNHYTPMPSKTAEPLHLK